MQFSEGAPGWEQLPSQFDIHHVHGSIATDPLPNENWKYYFPFVIERKISMKKASFVQQVRAAYALSNAMVDGVKPDHNSLKAIGLPPEFASRFER